MNLKLKCNRYYLFAVDKYDPLIQELGKVQEAIPDAADYVKLLDADIEAQKQAATSGDPAAMSRSVLKGAKDTKDGSYNVGSNPDLYTLADQTAPRALRDLSAGFAKGTKTAADENDLMGQFEKEIEKALAEFS